MKLEFDTTELIKLRDNAKASEHRNWKEAMKYRTASAASKNAVAAAKYDIGYIDAIDQIIASFKGKQPLIGLKIQSH